MESSVGICRRGATVKNLLDRFLVGVGGIENGEMVDTLAICTMDKFQWKTCVVRKTPKVFDYAINFDRLLSDVLYLHGGFLDLHEAEVSNQFHRLHTPYCGSCYAHPINSEHLLAGHLQWRTLEAPPIKGRAHHTLTSNKIRGDLASLYLFGGQGDHRECYNDILEYDVRADHWTVLNPTGKLPAPRYQHSMTQIGRNRLLLVGGLSATNQPMVDVHIYNTEANTWREVTISGAVPARLAGHTTSFVTPDLILVLGGNQRTNQTRRLNLLGRTWDRMPEATLEVSRHGHSTIPMNKKLLVVGGCDKEPWDAFWIDRKQGPYDPPPRPQSEHPMLLPPPIVNSGFTELVTSTRFSDATIILDDQTRLPVHMVILATGSEYFDNIAQFQGAEVSSREIRMSDVKHHTMLQFLEYTYGGGVLPEKQSYEDTVLAYKLADRLGSKCLKDHLCEHLTEEVTMDNLIELVNLGTETNSTKIVSRCAEYLKEHSEEAKENNILSKFGHSQMLSLMSAII